MYEKQDLSESLDVGRAGWPGRGTGWLDSFLGLSPGQGSFSVSTYVSGDETELF